MNTSTKKSVSILIGALSLAIIAALLYFFVFSNSAKFGRLINNADKEYAANRLEEARTIYYRAAEIVPGNNYPQKRIASIDSIIGLRVMMDSYNKHIQVADSLFELKKYVQSREYYFEALNLNSDKEYPVDQIKLIEDLLEEKKPDASRNEIGNKKNFYVIVGVFETEENAADYNKKLREQGIDSKIIPREKFNMNAVSYGSYDNIHDAYNFLRMVQKDLNEQAWVLFYKFK